mgnify:CR=1 FL=1
MYDHAGERTLILATLYGTEFVKIVGMELVIPLALTAYTEYTVEVPEGAVCIKDNPEVFAPDQRIECPKPPRP